MLVAVAAQSFHTVSLNFAAGVLTVEKRSLSPALPCSGFFNSMLCYKGPMGGEDLPREARLAAGNGRYHTQD
jgi:hypothetical protein